LNANVPAATVTAGATEIIEVKSVTLNEVVKEDVLLMKVDVEGWEWSVIKGANEMLRNHKVENIIMEYSPGAFLEGQSGFVSGMAALPLVPYWSLNPGGPPVSGKEMGLSQSVF
jgi:hypothetical protein